VTAINIELPPKLIPVFEGKADFRGAYGGRGSAKTRSFAMMTAVRGAMLASNGESGQILCAREQLNSLNDSSFAEVKAAILGNQWLVTML
jgi:phage terminase large subunit